MRVAEYFMNRYFKLNNAEFLVGNIAPDCGVPERGEEFIPAYSVTHWETDGLVSAKLFRDRMLGGYLQPFLLGYYIHLLTDMEWTRFVRCMIDSLPLYADFPQNPETRAQAKKDWYGQDVLYLARNPNSIFYSMFLNIKDFPNRYLDYYTKDALTDKVEVIRSYYHSAAEDPDRVFPYLSREDMDGFVVRAIEAIEPMITH